MKLKAPPHPTKGVVVCFDSQRRVWRALQHTCFCSNKGNLPEPNTLSFFKKTHQLSAAVAHPGVTECRLQQQLQVCLLLFVLGFFLQRAASVLDLGSCSNKSDSSSCSQSPTSEPISHFTNTLQLAQIPRWKKNETKTQSGRAAKVTEGQRLLRWLPKVRPPH